MKYLSLHAFWRPQQIKLFAQRFALATLITISFGLVVLGKIDAVLIERGRAALVDVMAPVLQAIARPVSVIRDSVQSAHSWFDVWSENVALRQDNERLRAWQAAARRLAGENASLRELMRVRPDPRSRFITALVIAEGGGPFVRTAVIDAGTAEGVAAGQVAVTGDGVVGRVLAAGINSARILLLTDLNSRVPVTIEGSDIRAILEGDNTALPRLAYYGNAQKIRLGDRLVTAGIGGLYPAGLPVGVVDSVVGGVPRVRPWVRFDRLSYVEVVDYTDPAVGDLIPSPGAPPMVPAGGYGAPIDPATLSAQPPPPLIDPAAAGAPKLAPGALHD